MKLIGIAGGTCSGKTTLLRNLGNKLGDDIATLTFDEYFIGSDLYNLDDITNFENPELYDYKAFVSDLEKLKSGKSLTIRSNSRESSEAGVKQKTVVAKPLVIVEGFLIFHYPEARELFDQKIFVDLPDGEILQRRFARTKGTRHWDSRDYIQNKILPYHHKYVMPQKIHADVVLSGSLHRDELLAQALELITQASDSSTKPA